MAGATPSARVASTRETSPMSRVEMSSPISTIKVNRRSDNGSLINQKNARRGTTMRVQMKAQMKAARSLSFRVTG